jgi:hypothetical protein
VQWVLAIPHLAIASVLSSLRHLLIAISLVTVLFTKRIPRQVFDTIAMTYRYEWRSASYAFFLHDRYPPFDRSPSGHEGPEGLTRNAQRRERLDRMPSGIAPPVTARASATQSLLSGCQLLAHSH